MKTNTSSLLSLLLLALPMCMNAQYFNQFDHAPQYLNPALVGNFDGQVRFNFNNRDNRFSSQGNFPARVLYTSMFLDGHSEVSDIYDFGAGLSLYTNRSEAYDFQEDGIRFHMSGVKYFGDRKSRHKSIGLGYSTNRIRQVNSEFEIGYWTHSMGATYRVDNGMNFKYEIGLSVLEFNAPRIELKADDTYKVNSQTNFHMKAEYSYNYNLIVMPAIYNRYQASDIVTIIGSDIRNLFPETYLFTHFNVGAYVQVKNEAFREFDLEQLILRSSAKYKMIDFGLAVNLFGRELATENRFTTVELFFTYILNDEDSRLPVFAFVD